MRPRSRLAVSGFHARLPQVLSRRSTCRSHLSRVPPSWALRKCLWVLLLLCMLCVFPPTALRTNVCVLHPLKVIVCVMFARLRSAGVPRFDRVYTIMEQFAVLLVRMPGFCKGHRVEGTKAHFTELCLATCNGRATTCFRSALLADRDRHHPRNDPALSSYLQSLMSACEAVA